MTVREISERLGICEETVYDMLREQVIPNIRYGRRFIISRAAYEKWEASIGEVRRPAIETGMTPLPKTKAAKAA